MTRAPRPTRTSPPAGARPTAAPRRRLAALLLGLLALGPGALAQDGDDEAAEPDLSQRESSYYPVHTVPIPEGITLEVGGLLPLSRVGDGDGDRLLVCTRYGEIWRVDDAMSSAPRFSLWADGLQEPLGLHARDGWIYCVQRGELTRLADTDDDGRADVYETVCDDWRLSGSYHEYAFGPAEDHEGNLWVTLNVPFDAQPFGKADWRGFAVRIPADGGPMEPVAGGLRSPAGVATSPTGDVFSTDNQGEWCGASKLVHLREGSFHGHPRGIFSAERDDSLVAHPGELPDGILMPAAVSRVPGFTLPAVWFPYDVTGRSPSGMAWDLSGGAFGPFAGQLFVGDQYGALLDRVVLEQVEGVWQGAVLPFRRGLASGVLRVAQEQDGAMWVGMSDRGWSSLGPEPYGLQQVRWSGVTPFEILSIEARSDGFHLEFTEPVDPESALDPESWALRRFTYRLHSDYGSPEVDDWPLDLEGISVSGDGLSLELVVSDLREGYVHELLAPGLRSVAGDPLLHHEAWYTLLVRPGGPTQPRLLRLRADETHAAATAWQELVRRMELLGVACQDLDVRALEPRELVSAVRDHDLLVLDLGDTPVAPALAGPLLDALESGRPFLTRLTPEPLVVVEGAEAGDDEAEDEDDGDDEDDGAAAADDDDEMGDDEDEPLDPVELQEAFDQLHADLLAWPPESEEEDLHLVLQEGRDADAPPAVRASTREGARLLLTSRSLTELLADRRGPLSDLVLLWSMDLAPDPFQEP